MPKQRQEETHSDLEDKRSLSLSPAITEGGDQEMSDDIRISGSVVMERQRRYERLIQGVEKAKYNIKEVKLATLSRVVNRAFTGWTIKTQN